MTRHGKNCTAGAVYTYHEKKKDTGESHIKLAKYPPALCRWSLTKLNVPLIFFSSVYTQHYMYNFNLLCLLFMALLLLSGIWVRNTEHSTRQRRNQRLWLLLLVPAALPGSCGNVRFLYFMSLSTQTHTLTHMQTIYDAWSKAHELCNDLHLTLPPKSVGNRMDRMKEVFPCMVAAYLFSYKMLQDTTSYNITVVRFCNCSWCIEVWDSLFDDWKICLAVRLWTPSP